jgi:uncharacterized protein YjbJ (UPF0337 family)
MQINSKDHVAGTFEKLKSSFKEIFGEMGDRANLEAAVFVGKVADKANTKID